MEESNPYAPPKSAIEHIPEEGGVWRKEKLLVMRKGSQLPGRCIYCNEEAELGKIKRIHYLSIWLKV